jgi:MFS transporter, DHA2 family, multidrug resistance protein
VTFNWRAPTILSVESGWYKWVILINIIMTGISGVISANAGFIVDTSLRGDLQLSSDDMRWVSISFIMMLGIMLPLAIYLSERYGYKRMFFCGTAVFLVGSLFNSVAFDYPSILLSRAIGGIGAGTLFPISIAVIDKVFPKKQITIAIALYVGCSFGVGTSLGFWAGGYFAQYVSWKFPFFICFFISIFTLLATWIFHRETPPNFALKFDRWGYVTFVVFIASILLILNSAKAQWNVEGWNSSFLWSCYVLGFLSFIILIILELKNPYPLISLALFKIKSFLLGCIAIFFIGAPLYSTSILAVTFLDGALHYEKNTIGLYLATLGLTLGGVSTCAAFLSKKVGVRVLTLAGMTIIALTCFMSPSISLYSSHGQFLWIWNLRMAGIGMALGPATALALSDLVPAVAGAASVFITLFRQVGGTLGSLWTEVVMFERNIFHQEMFGSQVDLQSPAFQSVISRIKGHLILQTGATTGEAETAALALVRENLQTQAIITSINDAFFLLGMATLISVIALTAEMGWNLFHKQKMSTQSKTESH